MREEIGISISGDFREASASIHEADALVMITSAANFEKHTRELAEAFPNVPSIGGIGMSYGGNTINEKGITLIALFGADAKADVIEELSTMPIKYIERLEDAIRAVDARSGNSVCFDFTTGHDGKLVTTLNTILSGRKIPLIGGTVDGKYVSVNGKIYSDSCAFLLLKNRTGKIFAYKENIYRPTGKRFMATKTDPSKNLLIEVDGQPAATFYQKQLGINASQVAKQTFKNPFGRIYGNETYLISVKEIVGTALSCFKQTNNLDILTIMEIEDYKKTVEETITKIRKELGNVNGILSVNCLFRYLLFKQDGYLNEYFKKMGNAAEHAGMIGVGEHYCKQHVNQTMCCIAFN
jgi:hypothetical protein